MKLLLVGLLAAALPGAAQAAESTRDGTTLVFRHNSITVATPGSTLEIPRLTLEARELIAPVAPTRSGLLSRYQKALEGEGRRFMTKDAWMVWGAVEDEEGNRPPRLQRQAERIFSRANGRALSQLLEEMAVRSPALRDARDYVEGVRLDLIPGQGMDLRVGGPESRGSRSGASVGLVALGDPRIEVSGRMGSGLKARLELPLAGDGVRATLSLPLASRVRCTLDAGREGSGEGTWLSAGIDLKF